jgi:hypothetical protein
MMIFRTIIEEQLAPHAVTLAIEARFRAACGDLQDRMLEAAHGGWADPRDDRDGIEVGFLEAVLLRRGRISTGGDLIHACSDSALLRRHPALAGMVRSLASREALPALDLVMDGRSGPIGSVALVTGYDVAPHVNPGGILAHLVAQLDSLAGGSILCIVTIGRGHDLSARLDGYGATIEEAGRRLADLGILTTSYISSEPVRARPQGEPGDPACGVLAPAATILLAEIPDSGLTGVASRIEGDALSGMIDVLDWCEWMEEGAREEQVDTGSIGLSSDAA